MHWGPGCEEHADLEKAPLSRPGFAEGSGLQVSWRAAGVSTC